MKLMLDDITETVSGTRLGRGDLEVQGYSIDTRTLRPGDLFFAIRGPNFDGHNFVQEAMAKKAAGAVVEQGRFEAGDAFAAISVGSSLEALQTLAREVRRRWGKPIVAVTGSAGKTTTREMIATVLAKRFGVLRSIGNLNNEYGLPLCLLQAEFAHDIGVLEMGMSAKGEIRKLASIAEPNEGVITNVNPVHLEFFDSVDAIAEAKAELLEGLVAPRIAYLNYDDSRVRAMAARFQGSVVSYAVNATADFKAEAIRDPGLDGAAFRVRHEAEAVDFVLPLLGAHNIINALAAIAVGASHGIPWDDIRSAVAEMKPEKMRGEVLRFDEGFVVIDDTYNSNPKALTEMIRFCGRVRGHSRRIIVAGEMLELGNEAVELHQECGREAAKAKADLVIGVRGLAREILTGAAEAGLGAEKLKFVSDAVRAGELLTATVKEGDLVLIKGSRGVRLEQAIQALRAARRSSET